MALGKSLLECMAGFGAGWGLSHPALVREGQRARVYRCCSTASGFETVILKQITDAGVCGFTDWASLRFLGEIQSAGGLVPRFLAGDAAGSEYLIEDLGGSTSLETLLTGRDATALTGALHRLTRVYAELHVAALGGEARFLEVRGGLPGATDLGRHAEAKRWMGALPKLERWADALGVALPTGFEQATEAVAHVYAEPGPFLAFTHGDPAPTNNHVGSGRVRLLDFEYGAYRHCLYDLTAWEVLCPLGDLVVTEMRHTYRDVIRTAIPEVEDDLRFRREWATLCAYRALAMLTWIPPEVLERNHPWAGDWTAREAACTALGRLARACEGIEPLAPVQAWSENAEGALLRRCPELKGALPRWPVFDAV
jgi:hypothetical protein